MAWLCRILEISRSGYYAWLRRGASCREQRDHVLTREFVRLHQKYPAMGLDSLFHLLKPVFHCSRKGNPYDNAAAENFFSCLKCERVHLQHYATRRAAQADIFLYIEVFYNSVRPHSAIGWMSPCAFEQKLISAA